jgi:hypothetical protein
MKISPHYLAICKIYDIIKLDIEESNWDQEVEEKLNEIAKLTYNLARILPPVENLLNGYLSQKEFLRYLKENHPNL